ncbi:MAG: hypothetical protein NTY64_14645 [Deltaproteobacteria bacterium]|nr:hypothetical protein [Deltaproteobacteria bacterium]
MMKKLFGSLTLLLISLCLPLIAMAQHQHGGPPPPASGGEKKMESAVGAATSSSRTFMMEGGIKAAFSIMAMADHKKMLQDMKMKVAVDLQATHNIAVTLTDTGTNLPISEAVVKMKVVDPKGKDQVKLLDFTAAMNQYAGDFALSEKGKYQILILFKSGGKKYPAGFYFVLK